MFPDSPIIGFGCWPIAGITSLDVTEANSRNTLRQAYESGIRHFDTAYVYGYDGLSERLLGEELGPHRDEITIASKCGIHWENDVQVKDGARSTIQAECEESLRRLNVDVIDLYYLHSPDPNTPVEESAEALSRLKQQGKIRAVGISNFYEVELCERFTSVCPPDALQVRYNMLQRDIESELIPWCRQRGVKVVTYWALMKGLLAGKIRRDFRFDSHDPRLRYPVFRGEEFEKTQQLLDRLEEIAQRLEISIAQLVVAWTLHQPGIDVVLCGGKRPEQIQETAQARIGELSPEILTEINEAIVRRGPITA